MNDSVANPFNITKAVDFSDQEINDYWVDIPSDLGFVAMAKPASPMPMLILGGKGSGKTHLMRYFSFPLQRIRYGEEVLKGLARDKYIGVYLRCGGLNATRFRSKGQSDDVWADVFAYYMELWLAQLVLATISSLCQWCPELRASEKPITEDLLRSVTIGDKLVPSTFEDLSQLLRTMQQELDEAVNNAALTGLLPVRIAATRGSLIFGIPGAITSKVEALRSCSVLYLIDEFENLSESQQKYVNTLIRERQSPCSIKVGARMYGVRTFSTYSADEDNKEGSEYEVLQLDSILRNNSHYPDFAKLLIAKRLAEFNHLPADGQSLQAIAETLAGSFDEPDPRQMEAEIVEKYAGQERPYFKQLRQHLQRADTRDPTIRRVLTLLSCPERPLLEKLNLFLFYREWSARANLIEAAQEISEACIDFLTHRPGTNTTQYRRTLGHFKSDLMAQLLRDTDQRQRFVGLDTFIEISSGLPRNLLIVLKHIFAWSVFNGEKPFRANKISIKSQQSGVMEASEWFYRDARMIGRHGQLVMDSVTRLGTLFRGIRYSEKPAECSCSTFSADLSRGSGAARYYLDLALKWSLLIDVGTQRDRNTDRIDGKYQLSRMLAPRWDLAIFRRGVIALSPQEMNAIFDPEHSAEFERLAEVRFARMRAPYFAIPPVAPPIQRRPKSRTRSLFGSDDHD